LIFVLLSCFFLTLLPIANGQQQQQKKLVIDLKPFCPTPGNQEEIGACVGFAAGYGAMSILQAVQHQWTDAPTIEQHVFSASFIYNQIPKKKDNCKGAIKVEDALQLLKEKGNCLERDFEFTNDCLNQPNEEHLISASIYKIKDYKKIFSSKRSDTLTVNAKISLIKQYLNDSIPVIVDFQLYRSFKELKKGMRLWIKKTSKFEKYQNLHTMVIIGFNENENTFEVMNSWGTEWGNNGFIKIGFEEFIEYCSGGYVILPK